MMVHPPFSRKGDEKFMFDHFFILVGSFTFGGVYKILACMQKFVLHKIQPFLNPILNYCVIIITERIIHHRSLRTEMHVI